MNATVSVPGFTKRRVFCVSRAKPGDSKKSQKKRDSPGDHNKKTRDQREIERELRVWLTWDPSFEENAASKRASLRAEYEAAGSRFSSEVSWKCSFLISALFPLL